MTPVGISSLLPQDMIPQPQTLNPKRGFLNPKPQTLNPKRGFVLVPFDPMNVELTSRSKLESGRHGSLGFRDLGV